MFGARKIASSDAYAMWPARYCLKTSDSPSKTLRPSCHRLECTWHDEPIQRWSGLAMNVTDTPRRSEEHTSELQSHVNLVCRLLLEKKKKKKERQKTIEQEVKKQHKQ